MMIVYDFFCLIFLEFSFYLFICVFLNCICVVVFLWKIVGMGDFFLWGRGYNDGFDL